jgi:hypothetical protein
MKTPVAPRHSAWRLGAAGVRLRMRGVCNRSNRLDVRFLIEFTCELHERCAT